ncbi:hypothetical protein [Schleiferilactobacillus harbinensis]|uniref:hypothetical protein n=1 Tax=Schleiferilactobacillus harbinensis TaxID=304207 RepID=UPI00242AA5FF|nr:hypothetical protein [Schleiferilactobacillus harbinensis]MCI1687766.1 hypothetical protein [Schleiferilactobacillus harbinensis]MCI1782287.1 hypothetical protein [Schleiferilactobacillus harbinensis]MCI1850154.1 hypothetical protein [Schleiferilactobacillus harbinensis]
MFGTHRRVVVPTKKHLVIIGILEVLYGAGFTLSPLLSFDGSRFSFDLALFLAGAALNWGLIIYNVVAVFLDRKHAGLYTIFPVAWILMMVAEMMLYNNRALAPLFTYGYPIFTILLGISLIIIWRRAAHKVMAPAR